MTGWLIAVGIVLIISLLANVIVLIILRVSEFDNNKLTKELQMQVEKTANLDLNLQQTCTRLIDEKNLHAQILGHLELVIANYQQEISNLEKDFAQCRDPAVIRTRLSKLLASNTTDKPKR
jgi:superfamily II helicase